MTPRLVRNIISKKKGIDYMGEMTVEEMQENVTNILAGIKAQNGFRKMFVEEVVRRLVTDTTMAEAALAELNTGFEKADAKFEAAAEAEAGEIDVPAPDAENLTTDLFKL
jgi:hypothetical protein